MGEQEPSISELFDFGNNSIVDLSGLQQLDHYPYSGISENGDELTANVSVGNFSLLGDVDLSTESHDLTIESLTDSHLSLTRDMSFLTRLRKSGPLAQQSAELVMEAICAIPEQMTRRVTFPPFIHPHWNRTDLPEPLAVCMRIAQMFASRTSDIKPFIWRTIRAEQRHALDQVSISLLPYIFD